MTYTWDEATGQFIDSDGNPVTAPTPVATRRQRRDRKKPTSTETATKATK